MGAKAGEGEEGAGSILGSRMGAPCPRRGAGARSSCSLALCSWGACCSSSGGEEEEGECTLGACPVAGSFEEEGARRLAVSVECMGIALGCDLNSIAEVVGVGVAGVVDVEVFG